mgnify:CR=1 FL=1
MCGFAVLGKNNLHYWAIGTRTPHYYVSKITDTKGDVVYENDKPYDFSAPSWGVGRMKKEVYRKEIGWQQADDPPNPFLQRQNYIQHSHPITFTRPVSQAAPGFPERMAGIGAKIFYLPGKVFDYAVSLLRANPS